MKTTQQKPLRFAHIIGDYVGFDYSVALYDLFKRIGVQHESVMIGEELRTSGGLLNPSVLTTLKQYPVSIKGPTETIIGKGAPSLNVALRIALDLFANVRPISYIPGTESMMKYPERTNIVVFRENTEDVYSGIEFAHSTGKSEKFRNFLTTVLEVPEEKLPYKRTGYSVKPMSVEASMRIMEFALKYMLERKGRHLGIMHKGNIMKATEGLFVETCTDVASGYSDSVYVSQDPVGGEGLRVSQVIADNAFQQVILKPDLFDGLVTPNLNGDFISDMIAAMVGGVNLCACANIGNDHAMFETIGGTAKDQVGKDTANPTAFFMAAAMMLEHQGHIHEASKIRHGIMTVLGKGHGTADIVKSNPMTTSQFTYEVAEAAKTYKQEKAKELV